MPLPLMARPERKSVVPVMLSGPTRTLFTTEAHPAATLRPPPLRRFFSAPRGLATGRVPRSSLFPPSPFCCFFLTIYARRTTIGPSFVLVPWSARSRADRAGSQGSLSKVAHFQCLLNPLREGRPALM